MVVYRACLSWLVLIAFIKISLLRRLRSYPPRFGLKLVRLHHRFIMKKEALPLPPASAELLPDSGAFALFRQLDWNDWWEDANMKSVFCYLRGSKSLELNEWRPLFPTHV